MTADAAVSLDDRTNATLALPTGHVLLGKFRVERVLGEGGMGVVLEATHLQLDERVALKFLKREAIAQPDVVARFMQEARAAAKLKSEHVARVLDVGELSDGSPFLVMEYLQGSDLSQVLYEEGQLSIPEAVDAIVQACEALAEAHARGIVHRDIKPENLFLVRRDDGWGTIKVLDFGISKVALTGRTSEVSVGAKDTTAILGTPFYMSPEQIRSTRDVDHRTDIWSLGAVLFELLTGATAFRSQEFTALVAEIVTERHRSLKQFRGDAPEGLEEVIDRCLAKSRGDRFANTAELAVALVPFGTKRSRVAAEKAVNLVRASGALGAAPSNFPVSVAPPPISLSGTGDASQDLRRSTKDRAPASTSGVIRSDSLATVGLATGATVAVDPGDEDSVIPFRAAVRGSRVRPVALGAAAVLIAVAVGLLVARAPGDTQPATVSAVTASEPPPAMQEGHLGEPAGGDLAAPAPTTPAADKPRQGELASAPTRVGAARATAAIAPASGPQGAMTARPAASGPPNPAFTLGKRKVETQPAPSAAARPAVDLEIRHER
jgi:serine/threonine-protein kinase